MISKADEEVPLPEAVDELVAVLDAQQTSHVRASAMTGEGLEEVVALIRTLHDTYREKAREEEAAAPAELPRYGIDTLPNRGMVVG